MFSGVLVRRIRYIFGSVCSSNTILIFSGVFVLILLYVMQCYVNTTATEVAS